MKGILYRIGRESRVKAKMNAAPVVVKVASSVEIVEDTRMIVGMDDFSELTC